MRKRLKIILIVVTILSGIVMIDTLQAILLNNSTLLKIRKDYDLKNICYVDKGLFVNHYYCTNKEEKTLFKGKEYTCPDVEKSEKKIKEIIDNTKGIKEFSCEEAIDEFYKDNNYSYYFNCKKSDYILVRYEDGYEETIKDALKNGKITIKDLDVFKVHYLKQEIININEPDIKLCLNSQLGGYITTELNDVEELSVSDLVDIDLSNIEYSFIGKSESGIYAIIKTNDNSIKTEIDKHFNMNYSGYQLVEHNDYKIYAYNQKNNINLENDLAHCFK